MEAETPDEEINIKQFFDILDNLLRRKALIVSCILIATTLGLVIYLMQPKTYKSTALLNYQQQRVNPAKMSPDEGAYIKDIVSTLSDIVTSRTSLEKIIIQQGLYKAERETLTIDRVVGMMRQKISITPANRGDTFIVSFEATDPEKVARVTNELAYGFIQENMKYREEKAAETSTYTQDELSMAKEILDRKEAVMRDYKLKSYNEMPEQQAVNMSRLNSLQNQYQSIQVSIGDLERTRVLSRDQLANRRQMLSNSTLGPAQKSPDNQPIPVENDRMKLKHLQKELQELQGRYTEKHPEIKYLKKEISHLEQTVEPAKEKDENRTNEKLDSTILELQAEITGIGMNIEKMEKEKVNIQNLIKQYEQWVAAAPIREAEWSALTREYGELKRHYDFLVSQNLQAGSALNLELKQKGSQFKVVDAARTPMKPVKPNFLKIMAMALLAGCGLGGGVAIGMGFLDTSFKEPTKLSEAFELEVICSVPRLPLDEEVSKQRRWTILGTIFFLVWGLAIVIMIIYYWKQGQIII